MRLFYTGAFVLPLPAGLSFSDVQICAAARTPAASGEFGEGDFLTRQPRPTPNSAGRTLPTMFTVSPAVKSVRQK